MRKKLIKLPPITVTYSDLHGLYAGSTLDLFYLLPVFSQIPCFRVKKCNLASIVNFSVLNGNFCYHFGGFCANVDTRKWQWGALYMYWCKKRHTLIGLVSQIQSRKKCIHTCVTEILITIKK